MNIIYILILLAIIIIGIIIIGYVFNYNKIQSLNIKINESTNIIDEELRNKYDLLLKTQNIIEKQIKKELPFYNELINLKEKNISSFDMDRKITEGEILLEQIKNDNKTIKENEEYIKILDNIKISDETLDAAKSFYNKYTTELNLLLKKFPTNIIGFIHKIKVKNYFDGKDLFDEEIKDFKL